ncbi:MAG: SIR2 family protein [Deltaproteobacteria bacterium]|nr:SIR2 family protein [Deltaproteobacteria bacterium]
MYEYFEIAYALANESLCLFLGTGFSKQITDGKAPSWLELLQHCCDELGNPDPLKKKLFPGGENELPLEECAQIIELQLNKEGKDLRKIITNIISNLEVDDALSKEIKEFFNKHDHLKIITTSYDTLIERFLAPGKCNSYCPGKPIPKRKKGINVYHIHGSIDSPNDMIVTASDYYNFINSPSYFRNKIYNLIQEYTTVIIGYSLTDPNLKPIFNYYSTHNLSSLNRSSLFYVTKNSVPLHIKDHYEYCYSIRVLEKVGINRFIQRVEHQYKDAEEKIERRQEILKRILDKKGKKKYKDDFLKSRHSFFHIISAAEAIGENVKSGRMKKLIADILQRKIKFTSKSGAWDQYDHLAEWLVYLGSVMDLKGTLLEKAYLKGVYHSMTTMSRERYLGYCWEAYQTWRFHWESLTRGNRAMIKEYVERECPTPNALRIVNEGKLAF